MRRKYGRMLKREEEQCQCSVVANKVIKKKEIVSRSQRGRSKEQNDQAIIL
jgi:hypothetical protein